MNPLKEAMIEANDFLPIKEAWDNSESYDEYIEYLQAKIGGKLDEDQLEDAGLMWEELISNSK